MINFKIDVFKSNKPVYEINEGIKRINFLKDNINDGSISAVKNIVSKGETIAKRYYSSTPQTGLTKSNIVTKVLNNGQGGYIALQGPQAFYEEFGTGEEGASDPHPMKSLFNLNPYNSGPYVSTHINEKNGKHYWFYSPMAGKPYFEEGTGYTEGTPSGKPMYYTSKDLEHEASKIAKDIIEKAIKTKALK